MTTSPAWPHSDIKEIFTNIFFVTGTNITQYNNVELQHSRNMIILRDNNSLSLINTVRLDEKGLEALDNLGDVKHVINIGAFHGRDNAFYVDKYQAKLWTLENLKEQIPFPDCSLFIFETSRYPEGILHLAREEGILITCDSIKNWLAADKFFSDATAKMYEAQGFFGPASISQVWRDACGVEATDF